MPFQENMDLQHLGTSLETFTLSSDSKNQKELKTQIAQDKIVLNLENDKEAVLHLDKEENYSFLKLEKLNISSCDLIKVPNVVFKFKYLTDLNLSNNYLENLPDEIKLLQNLIILNLSSNKLTCLPKTLKYVYQLTYLNLSHNKFFEVPNVFYSGLRNIKILDLSFNEISKFEHPPECLNKLLELRLSNNALESMPAWIFNSLCHLKILDLSENSITTNSSPIVNYYNSGIFETLQVLNIENCDYTYEKLEFLSHFRNLEILHVGNKKEVIKKKVTNYLGNLKMDIFKNFRKIKSLYLDNAHISLLPADFDCLKSIEFLTLSCNLLTWLPESFHNFIYLKILDLSSNQILFLPDDIDKLASLEEIHLENNKLYQLPESFTNLVNLKFVDLYNNKLEKIDKNIFKRENLKGIDLGLNCLDFNLMKCHPDVDATEERYNRLKNVFRKEFNFTNSRDDTQITERNSEELSYSSSVCSAKNSASLCEGELDFEDSAYSVVQEGDTNNDENWEEANHCEDEEDELFDPNNMEGVRSRTNKYSWKFHFRNNFCPANSHARSLMMTCKRNYVLALKNDSVEEGQFDSD